MTSNHRPQQKRREGPPNPPNPTLSNRNRTDRGVLGSHKAGGAILQIQHRTSPQNQGLVDVNIQTDPYCVLWSHVTMQLAAPPLETSSSNRIRRRVYLISDLYHTVYAPAPTPRSNGQRARRSISWHVGSVIYRTTNPRVRACTRYMVRSPMQHFPTDALRIGPEVLHAATCRALGPVAT